MCIKGLSEYIYGVFRNMDFTTDFNRLNRFIKVYKDITLNNNVIYKDIYKNIYNDCVCDTSYVG